MARIPARPGAGIVALETSTRRGSLALEVDGRRFEAELSAERSHGADLLPELDRLARQAGLERIGGRLALATILVGTGPGSFTGLRVGIATALGLARATGARLRGIPSIEALAWVELAPGEEGTVLLDARASLFHVARYRREADLLLELEAPRALAGPEVARAIPADEPLLGSGEGLEELGLPRLRERLRRATPRAVALLELGRRRAGGADDPAALEPLYLAAPPARLATPPQR